MGALGIINDNLQMPRAFHLPSTYAFDKLKKNLAGLFVDNSLMMLYGKFGGN